ncbi:hypothetical protein AVEN_171316-1 [Araneus ventricosus]|uniref:Uncharacterized protein n=1 Tax=Araneus ventricosus TaxID=182803 RepID=A0A4Y2M4P3_ARAVE|nr:hypothetical protein AVEN_171316-1 [Araneus ventricosus]
MNKDSMKLKCFDLHEPRGLTFVTAIQNFYDLSPPPDTNSGFASAFVTPCSAFKRRRWYLKSTGSILVPPVGLGDVTFPVVNVRKSDVPHPNRRYQNRPLHLLLGFGHFDSRRKVLFNRGLFLNSFQFGRGREIPSTPTPFKPYIL